MDLAQEDVCGSGSPCVFAFEDRRLRRRRLWWLLLVSVMAHVPLLAGRLLDADARRVAERMLDLRLDDAPVRITPAPVIARTRRPVVRPRRVLRRQPATPTTTRPRPVPVRPVVRRRPRARRSRARRSPVRVERPVRRLPPAVAGGSRPRKAVRSVVPVPPAISRPARVVVRREPRYPLLARRHGLQGRVVLRLRIDRRGRVTVVEVVRGSGFRILDRAAIEAVEAWRFRPALERGVAVVSSRRITVRFRLREPASDDGE